MVALYSTTRGRAHSPSASSPLQPPCPTLGLLLVEGGWTGGLGFFLSPIATLLGPDTFSSSSCRARAPGAGVEQTLSMELVGPCAYLKPLFTKCFRTASLLGDLGFSRRAEGSPLISTE